MKKNFFALLTMFAFTLSAFSFSFAETNYEKSSLQVNQLAAQLPISDAVLTLDMQRLMNVAVPQILASKPQMINEINTGIDKFKAASGIDLRQFEQVAVGLAFRQTSPQQLDFDPVLLARGKFSSASLLTIAKTTLQGKHREEKLGDKTIYIFSPKQIFPPNNKPKDPNKKPGTSKIAKAFERMEQSLSNELAIAPFDNNTLAIGSPARVRESLDTAKTRISSEVLGLVGSKQDAILNFGVNMRQGLSMFVDMGDDDFGRKLKAVNQMYGSIGVGDANVRLSLAAKTSKPEDAKALEEMLAGLQMIGKGFLRDGKGADKQVYARMLENARITRSANQVMLDLQVPQGDINILLLGQK